MMPFEVTDRSGFNSIATYWATSDRQKARLAFIIEANWFKIEISYVSPVHGRVELLVTMESKKELRNFLEVVGARQPFTRSCCATMLLKHNDQHVIIAHIEPGAMEEWVKECGEILAALPLREKLVESGMIHLLGQLLCYALGQGPLSTVNASRLRRAFFYCRVVIQVAYSRTSREYISGNPSFQKGITYSEIVILLPPER